MTLFEAKCNLVLKSEGKSLLTGDTIELTKERAEGISKIVKGIFPDIPQALVPVSSEDVSEEKPKRSRKKVTENIETDS